MHCALLITLLSINPGLALLNRRAIRKRFSNRKEHPAVPLASPLSRLICRTPRQDSYWLALSKDRFSRFQTMPSLLQKDCPAALPPHLLPPAVLPLLARYA